MKKWEPLNDIWEHYSAEMFAANERGLLDDPETAEDAVYPRDLHLGTGEKDDIREFVGTRMQEILIPLQEEKIFDPNQIASYIFRALVCGMKWQAERVGS